MDFSHNYFGGPASQPYQFIGIPPLTPGHSNNSAASEEFNQQSPPEVFDNNFQRFDQYAQYSHQPSYTGPPGPPTPPTHPLRANSQGGAMNRVDGASGPVRNHQADIMPMTKPDFEQAARQTASNSDEEDLTPAQSRRKAQNRAAQRAFRERKERHVKDLEAKLASLEKAQQQTASENEQLKRDIQKISTENEILRATSSMQNSQNSSVSPPAITTTGPMRYNPTDFYSDLLANHDNKTPSHRISKSEAGERLLAAGATWDFIIDHELFKRGLVDVEKVSDRLKFQAKCDGQGPVFEERAILQAIQESVASGSDELL